VLISAILQTLENVSNFCRTALFGLINIHFILRQKILLVTNFTLSAGVAGELKNGTHTADKAPVSATTAEKNIKAQTRPNDTSSEHNNIDRLGKANFKNIFNFQS
jgi:hypothetical protein